MKSVKRVFYISNKDLTEVKKKLANCRCMVSTETIEMDFSEVTITCPSIIATVEVERVIAPYV